MKSFLRCISFICVSNFLTISCEKTREDEVITLEHTNAVLSSIKLDRLEFPTESLSVRAQRIQEILLPYELTVSISDTLDDSREVDWVVLHKPTIIDLMRFTCGNRGIYWKVVPGGLEFHDSNSIIDPSIEYMYDAEDPFAPPKAK